MDNGITGISRWLNRVWSIATVNYSPKSVDPSAEKDLSRMIHKTIRKVTEDVERFRFNVMLAALMEYTNYLGKLQESGSVSAELWQESIKTLLLLLAPSAPHITEELWTGTGLPYSIHNQSWPKWDPELAKEEALTLVIQINGKLRDKVEVPVTISESEAKELALGREKIVAYLDNKAPRKVIYVPGKLINIVI